MQLLLSAVKRVLAVLRHHPVSKIVPRLPFNFLYSATDGSYEGG